MKKKDLRFDVTSDCAYDSIDTYFHVPNPYINPAWICNFWFSWHGKVFTFMIVLLVLRRIKHDCQSPEFRPNLELSW